MFFDVLLGGLILNYWKKYKGVFRIYLLPDDDEIYINYTRHLLNDDCVVITDKRKVIDAIYEVKPLYVSNTIMRYMLRYIRSNRDTMQNSNLNGIYVVSAKELGGYEFQRLFDGEYYDFQFLLNQKIISGVNVREPSLTSNIIKRIRYIIKECVYLPIIHTPFYWLYTKIKFRRKDTLYVFIYQGIGDVVVSLGYINEYIRKIELNNGICFKHICLIHKERMSELYSMYDVGGAEQDCYHWIVSNKQYMKLAIYHEFPIGFNSINGMINVIFVHTYNYIKDNWNYFYNMPGMNFMTFIKKGIFCLADDAEFQLPQISNVNVAELKHRIGMKKNEEFIILNPYANTIHGYFDYTFWIELTEKLQEIGITVYTDCGKGDMIPVVGTRPIGTSLSEMYTLAKDSVAYIGLRSGIMDFLLLAGAKIIALYPEHPEPDGNEIFNAFDINGLNTLRNQERNCYQYRMNGVSETVQNVIDAVLRERRRKIE